MKTATITFDPQAVHLARVRFDYDERAVAAIKAVPGRRWDKLGKFWTVPCDVAHIAEGRLADLGYRVENEVPRPRHRAAPSPPTKGRFETLTDAVETIVAGVPSGQQDRVLKALAAASHPDLGGDVKFSQWVNQRRGLAR